MITHSLKRSGLFCTLFLIVLLTGVLSDGAYASPTYLSQYNAAYGKAATCSLCHTSPPTLNATGNTFLNGGHNIASIAPSGSSPSTPSTPTAPAAPSSPATAANPASPAAPKNPQATSASTATASSGPTTNSASNVTGQAPSSSSTQTTSQGTVQNTQGSSPQNASSSNLAEKEEADSDLKKSNLELSKSKKEDRDFGQSREFRQPSGAKRNEDSNTNRNSSARPKLEGSKLPKPNIQPRPPIRIRR